MSNLRRAARAKPKAKHKPKARPHGKKKHSAKITASEADRIAFNYFKSKGLTDEQAAGIVGNLDHEGGMNPAQHQIGGGPGRGIGQWSVGERWDTTPGDNVVEFARKEGKSPTSLEAQLGFTWYELNKFSYLGLKQLRSAKTVDQATKVFQDKYERPNKKLAGTADRLAHAKAVLAAFGSKGSRRIQEGEDSVVLGRAQQPAAHVESPDTGGGKVKEGHPTIFVGKKQLPFARVGDPTKIKDGMVIDGDSTVLLGGQPGRSGSGK
jgi:uncharacterized Zn-binding protein involved in type VI secretion